MYDGALPPDNTPYPFIYLGEFRQTDTANKTAVFGSVYPTIHVWHNDPHQRGTLSRMLYDVKLICRQTEHTNNYAWGVRGMSQHILPDSTTNTPLLHGIIEAEFFFS